MVKQVDSANESIIHRKVMWNCQWEKAILGDKINNQICNRT